jgi:2-polyprenyl-3-methyl-5-hydroxy-6-metoxy-1,4-benzoquinol methylase
MTNELLEKQYWDNFWASIQLPMDIGANAQSSVARGVFDVFERFIPKRPPGRVLEIGGAPGRFLTYWARAGYEAHALDYSAIGCAKTRENFQLLSLPVTVHEMNVRGASRHLPQFDIVYSLGFIEHFHDLDAVLEEHHSLLKPGGLLFLGVPHFIHVFWPMLSRLAPNITGGHVRRTLSPRSWRSLQDSLGMSEVFEGFVGGFDPGPARSVIREEWGCDPQSKTRASKLFCALIDFYLKANRASNRIWPALTGWTKCNSRLWSVYAMGVFQKT